MELVGLFLIGGKLIEAGRIRLLFELQHKGMLCQFPPQTRCYLKSMDVAG